MDKELINDKKSGKNRITKKLTNEYGNFANVNTKEDNLIIN